MRKIYKMGNACFLSTILLLSALAAYGQDTITGTVTEADSGDPLPGVNVLIKGSATGTATDVNGQYTLQAGSDDVLTFSFIGYTTLEMEVNGRSVVNVAMSADVQSLEEVVVTAFGLEQDKKSVTYATQDVSVDELTQARTLNVVNSLSGKIAGVSVNPGASGVGSGSKVVIRGNRSISGSSQPLYVVDGIILNGDIANLSPDDIENISVLRGANAAALYGARANNGAIVVTTKSGKGGPAGVSASIGFTYQANNPILLTNYQNEYGQGSAGNYAPAAVTSWGPRLTGQSELHWSNNPDFPEFGQNYTLEGQPDNVRDLLQTGHTFVTNLSVGVNSEKGSTFLSYTSNEASGIIPGNELSSHNVNLRLTSDMTDKLSVDGRVNYIRQDFANVLSTGEGFDNPYRYLYILPRNIRTQDIEDFDFINDQDQLTQHFYAPQFNGAGNPYWTINRVIRPRLRERVIGMLTLKYQITNDLSILGRSALDRTNDFEEFIQYVDTYTVAQGGGYEKKFGYSSEWNSDFLLNYKKDVTKDFSVDISFGGNLRVFQRDELRSRGNNLNFPNLFSIQNTTNPITTEIFREKRVQSIYGFARLGYWNAIFLDATIRNDWSSTLPSDNRSFSYPSFGLTAVVSDLIQLPGFITFVKLRGSWAEVGNDTDPFLLFQGASVDNGTIRLGSSLPEANLKPETTRSTEIGADIRFLDDKIRLDFTWYKTNSFDQLFGTPVPRASGVTTIFQNGADIENRGVEIVFGATPVSNADFRWDIDFNFAKNESEVLEIAEGFQFLDQGTDFIRTYRLEVGEPFGNVYSRGFLRDNEGHVIVDADGLPETTPGLDTKIANFNPDWLGGITNTLSYKNFTLSALIDIRQGGTIASFTEAVLAGDGLLDYTTQGRDGTLVFGENIFSELTAVTESGEPNNIQISAEDLWNRLGGRNTPVGEPFVRDASNIRLRELIIGYILPQSVTSRLPFKSGRISLVGRNLFFITNKAENVDPEVFTSVENEATVPEDSNSVFNEEVNGEGREAFAPPTTRTFGVSLKFDF